jgi:hypothetical protein
LSSLVVATDPWMDPAEIDRLGDVDSWRTLGAATALRRADPGSCVSLILDDRLQEVILFGKDGDTYGLYVEPGLLMMPVQAAGTEK